MTGFAGLALQTLGYQREGEGSAQESRSTRVAAAFPPPSRFTRSDGFCLALVALKPVAPKSPFVDLLPEAARASVMNILEIPFAYVLQYFVFGESISALGMVGVALVCSGMLLNLLSHLYRSRLKA